MTLLLALPLLPAAEAQTSHLAIEPIGSTTATLDTAHLVHRFRFRVTNHGDALDYVTIPRGGMVWTDTRQPVAGFPSPEFGLSLPPGASGEMWASVDPVRPDLGTRSAEIPFKSELTGSTTTKLVTIVVAPAPQPSVRFVIRTDAPDARIEVTDLTATTNADVRVQTSPGAATVDVAPGHYAIRADAPGRQGATRIVRAPEDAGEIALTLSSARWSAEASGLTRASADDSSWTLAGSSDLTRLVTMPMVHQQTQTDGHGVGFLDGERAWDVSFPAPQGSKPDAGPFQALDTTAAVSPDGARAALFDWNGVLRIVDAEDGSPEWTSSGGSERHPLYPPTSKFGEGFFTSGAVAFSRNSTHVAAGGSNGRLILYDAATGTPLWSRAYAAEIRALHFTRDGGLVVGSGDWKLHMLDAATGEPRWSSDAPEFWPFFFLAEASDGTRIATGGKDSAYRVWDTRTGQLLHELEAGYAFVTGGGIRSDGGTFSDWGYGVRSFDSNAEITWFRRFPQAIAATTDDGRFTLVAWWQPAGGASGIDLLDDSGTTLWRSATDTDAPCTSTLSPFPAKQWKTLLLTELKPGTLRYAAACIGGGVVTGVLTLRPLDTPTPMSTTPASFVTPGAATPHPPAATPSATTHDPAAATPITTQAPGPTPMPAGGWLALAALALAAARWRRGPPG